MGQPEAQKPHFWKKFIIKLDPEPKLGVLWGRAGSLKIEHNLPHHPKKPSQKTHSFKRYVIPLLLVPVLGGNNIDTPAVYFIINHEKKYIMYYDYWKNKPWEIKYEINYGNVDVIS